jgi:hypothetical protein
VTRDNELILPDKHIRVSESLVGLGGFVLRSLERPITIDELWSDFAKINNTKQFPAYHSFENLVMAVDFLFALGVIDQESSGRLFRCG